MCLVDLILLCRLCFSQIIGVHRRRLVSEFVICYVSVYAAMYVCFFCLYCLLSLHSPEMAVKMMAVSTEPTR